jgi:SAM-dependent methyltransferase
MGAYYHEHLRRTYRSLIPAGQRVLELGCGDGDLLAALKPSIGLGVDLDPETVQRAQRRHPELRFIAADAEDISLDEKFDYIILSDLVNGLWNVQKLLENLGPLCMPGTRVIVNTYSRVWELPLAGVKRLNLANPVLGRNWLTVEDLSNMLYLSGFEPIRHWQELLLPLGVPLLHSFCNKYLARIAPFRFLDLTNFIIARPQPSPDITGIEPVVSVVVPARNEAGNVEEIFRRVPEMGAGTEIIFVEGHSSDNTYEAIASTMEKFPHKRCKLMRQTGKGKGDAVRAGFAAASGEILMILDADLTVPPEDLPSFYRVLRSGKGDFVNGVRLVYPMENEAMRFFNLVGNKFFGVAFSWLLGQPIKDTLCGTKVLSRRNYELIAANRHYFGDFDPFGDFDLILGAAKLNLKIVDLPIRYKQRTYGDTNIQRWRHGVILLRMVLFASRRLKFI